MLPIVLIAAIDIALLAFFFFRRDPHLLLPAVVLLLPVEVFETQTLGALGEGGASGALRSLLNPGQALMVATVLTAFIRWRHEPARLIPSSSLVLPVVALLLLLLLGVAWSDSFVPSNSIAVVPLYVLFLFVAPSFIESRRDVERLIVAVLAAAVVLALLAVAQRGFGVFAWRESLIQSDGVSYRANATFASPNILARFLAVAMPLGAVLALATGPRRLTLWLTPALLLLGTAAIAATASRSGWLMLILTGFLVLLLMPATRYAKTKLAAAALLALGLGAVLLLWEGGADAERVSSIAESASVLGQREYLIRAGWEMFRDSPLIGVGAGNYQHALITSYLDVIPSWTRVSLSHTSLVSVLAEIGLTGVFLFAFVGVRLAVTIFRAYTRSGDAYSRAVLGWLAAAITGIALHSQSEGRLLDEPFLWVLLALVIAFELRPSLMAARDVPSTPPAAPPVPASRL